MRRYGRVDELFRLEYKPEPAVQHFRFGRLPARYVRVLTPKTRAHKKLSSDPINPSVSYCGYAAAACSTNADCDYGTIKSSALLPAPMSLTQVE